MGLLGQIGKLTANQARAMRASQIGERPGVHQALGHMDEAMIPQYLRSANNALGGGDLPNIGATGMTEIETEIVRRFQQGQRPEQIAQELYQGGVEPKLIEILLTKAQQKLFGAGELFGRQQSAF